MIRSIGAGLVLALAIALASAGTRAAPVLVEEHAAGDFRTVTDRIQTGLKARKMAIVRQIRFHDMLEAVGVASEQAMTFETFHPRYGKTVYENDKRAFIELPLRIHIRETGDGVVVRYRTPSSIFSGYDGLGQLAAELDALFADVVAEAVR